MTFKVNRDLKDKTIIERSIERVQQQKARQELQHKLSTQELTDFVDLDSTRFQLR
jgi:hypothetical protein